MDIRGLIAQLFSVSVQSSHRFVHSIRTDRSPQYLHSRVLILLLLLFVVPAEHDESLLKLKTKIAYGWTTKLLLRASAGACDSCESKNFKFNVETSRDDIVTVIIVVDIM